MQSLVIALMALAVVAVAAAKLEFDYNNPETIDVPAFFGDEDRKNAVFACLMDKEPCGEMQPLRDKLPIMVKTNCSHCTTQMKKAFQQGINYVLEAYPEEHQQLLLKYRA